MLGSAAVTMWWDIPADVRAGWEEWHTVEHMPERVGIPGFLRGTRWVGVRDEGTYFVLYETAEAEGIKATVEVSRGVTNTDADAMYLSRVGVATGLVSIPLRYMHSPIETADLGDIEGAVRLLVAFALRLEPGTSFAG